MKTSMMRHASSFFALSMCLIPLVNTACGHDGDRGHGASGTGATGTGATGGGDNGGGDNGGGGSGGGSDQACDHAGSDGGSNGPTCGQNQIRIAGDIDGHHVDDTLGSGWGESAGQTFVELPHFGLLYFPSVQAQPDDTTAARGLIRFPDESSLADSWYCAGYGSEISVGQSFVPYTATLDSLSLLGSCESGTPVSGEVENCFEASECNTWNSVSTIEGASFNVEIAGGYAEYIPNSKVGDVGLLFQHPTSDAPFAGSGFIKVESHDIEVSEPGAINTMPVARAFFVVPMGAPDAGAVYCAGEGSTFEYQFDKDGVITARRSTFKNLKRIGACPAANACQPGQLQICGG